MSKAANKLKSAESLVVSTSLCSIFFSTTERDLRRWKAKGCPVKGFGLWNLHDVFLWWQDNIMSSKADETDKDLGEIKKSYWKAKTRVEEVKASVLEEKYLPREKLAQEWSYRAGIYRAGLIAFGSRLPPLLVGKKLLKMRSILTDEASKLLASLSRDHTYCPETALPKDYLNLTKRKKTRTPKKAKPKKAKPKKKVSGPKKKPRSGRPKS